MGSKKILIVDDDGEHAGTVSDVLETAGYTTYVANDGLIALKILKEQAVDLILADIAMPRLNGYQLLSRLQLHEHFACIPVVFISGRNLDSDIRYGKMLGVDDYLVKPLNLEDLMAVVKGKLLLGDVRAHNLPVNPPPGAAAGKDRQRVPNQNPLQIDLARHRVRFKGKKVRLSAREFRLLVRLTEGSGEVISPQELVWTTHEVETDRTEAGVLLRPLLRTLRRKLGFPPGEMGFIENVRGVGYRLIQPEAEIKPKPLNNPESQDTMR